MSGSNVSSRCLCGRRVPARAGQVRDVGCRQPPWRGGPKAAKCRRVCPQELERAYSPEAIENASPTSRPTFTAEREAQDVEYAAAVRHDEEHDEEERQREEAERALASPVQVDVVRAARLRRLAGGGEIS